MNPELRRNLWLEFSSHRLLAMPAIIVLVALFLYAASYADGLKSVATVAGYAFLALVPIWGTRLAAESVTDEARGHTWDLQRMSSIGPWQMTWGKLAGATAFVWYGGAICLVLFVLAGTRRVELPVLTIAGVMIAVSVLAHGVALIAGLNTVRSGLAGRSSGSVITLLFLLAIAWPIGTLVTDSTQAVVWWHGEFFPPRFALASTVVFAAWAVFGAHRSMCGELQVRTTPWALAAFLYFCAVYVAGFTQRPQAAWPGGPAAIALAGLGVCLLACYLLLFSERTGAMTLRRLQTRIGRRQWHRALEELPGWPVALALAVPFACGASLLAGANGVGALRELGSAPIALVLFALRDAALLHFFAFARQPRRVEAVTLVYLVLLYWLVPSLLSAIGAESIGHLVLPDLFERPGFATAVVAVQAAVAVTIAAVRWRRNHGVAVSAN